MLAKYVYDATTWSEHLNYQIIINYKSRSLKFPPLFKALVSTIPITSFITIYRIRHCQRHVLQIIDSRHCHLQKENNILLTEFPLTVDDSISCRCL